MKLSGALSVLLTEKLPAVQVQWHVASRAQRTLAENLVIESTSTLGLATVAPSMKGPFTITSGIVTITSAVEEVPAAFVTVKVKVVDFAVKSAVEKVPPLVMVGFPGKVGDITAVVPAEYTGVSTEACPKSGDVAVNDEISPAATTVMLQSAYLEESIVEVALNTPDPTEVAL